MTTATKEGASAEKADSDKADKEKRSWAERWQETKTTFANIPIAFKLVWEAHPGVTSAVAAMTLLVALLPVAQAWAGKLIVDAVVHSINNKLSVEEGLNNALPFLLLEFILITINTGLSQIEAFLEHLMNARLAHSIQTAIMKKALSLDMHFFEDASFYDSLQKARREINWRPLAMVKNSFLIVQNLITLASVIIILLAFSPFVALILFGATIPSFMAQLYYSKLEFRLLNWRAPQFRRRAYWEHLLTADSSMKEVKLFGLGEPLLKRYDKEFWDLYAEDASLAKRRTVMSLLCGLLATASFYAAYAWTVWRTISGSISLGDMTLYLALFRQTQGSFRGLFYSASQLYEGNLFISNLMGFLKLESSYSPPEQPAPVPPAKNKGVEFRNVSFRYPNREEWTLRNVSLTIKPGEKLALVGANGAGKTTLVKLMTRLYEPTEGQILLDGVDLRDYEISELHERIGVIFQDFVRYHVTARENIGFGQIKALGDEPRILNASKRGGADTVVAELSEGYDTMLGSWFERGRELSGGQWQKVALSRAFMRDGEVLVLDEPTAALDAEREYEIFQRFRELTEGKIAVLISHRFSTVRMADRIAVIEGGEITELGSHAELVALGGTYASLFNMQAEGYR